MSSPPIELHTLFIAACCRWPQDDTLWPQLHRHAEQITDWDRLFEDIQRHRVVPMVFRTLGQARPALQSTGQNSTAAVPLAHLHSRLRPLANALVRQNLQQAAETLTLSRLLQAQGIEVAGFKGTTLEQRVYGQLGIKQCFDIDLYVAAKDAPAAIGTLEDRGYRMLWTDQPSSARMRAALARNVKDVALIHPKYGITELHWRLTALPKLLMGLESTLGVQTVEIPNIGSLRTFDDDSLFAYLCAHGAHHDWARLKWLVDVIAYWQSFSPSEQVQRLAAADRLGARQVVAQALGLGQLLFGLRPPEATQQASAIMEPTAPLIQHALAQMEQESILETANHLTLTQRRLKSQWLQRQFYEPRWRAVNLLFKQRLAQKDIITFPLPGYLNWVYPIIRVPSYIIRRSPALLRGWKNRRETS